MSFIRNLAFILYIVTFLTGCSLFEIANLKEPKISLEKIELKKAGLKNMTLEFGLLIENQNSFDLNLKALTYSAEIDNKKVLNESLNTPLSIPASGKKVVFLPVKFSYAGVLNALGRLLNEKETSYKLSGTATLGAFKVPFSKSGDFVIKDGKLQQIDR